MNGVIKKIRTAYVGGKRHGVYVEMFFPDQQLKWGDKIDEGTTLYVTGSNPHDDPYWKALSDLRRAEEDGDVVETAGKSKQEINSRFAALEVDE